MFNIVADFAGICVQGDGLLFICASLIAARVFQLLRMANKQSFEALDNESLNTSDLSLNGKGKGLSETVKTREARRWSDRSRSRAIFWANQYGKGLFSKDSR